MREHITPNEAIIKDKDVSVLPGRYAFMERFEEFTRVVTFQTLDEMQDYMEQIKGENDDATE